MALTLTRITGTVDMPNGETPDNGAVVFQLQNWDKSGANVFVPGPVVAPIAEDGAIDVSLQATTGTAAGFVYSVRVRYFSVSDQNHAEVILPNIAVPTTGPVLLADLLAIPAPTPNVPDVLAQALAAAGRAAASAQGMDANANAAAASASAAATSAQTATDKATAAAASAKQAADTASSVGIVIPTQAEAEAGTDNGKLMTPLRSYQAFLKAYTDRLATAAQVIAGTATNLIVTPANLPAWLASRLASRAEAEAGTDAEKLMTPLKVAQYVTKYMAEWFTAKAPTQAQAAAGTATDRIMTPLATEQHMMANALGWGQARAAFSADQRPSGTAQVNDTGRPIEITFSLEGGGGGCRVETSPDGTTFTVALRGININGQERLFSSLTIPPGHQYRPHYQTFYSWSELR